MGKQPSDLEVMQGAIREGEAILEAEGRRLEAAKMRRVAIGVCVVALLLFAWLFRYELQNNNNYSYMMLDRWTGSVYSCGHEGNRCILRGTP